MNDYRVFISYSHEDSDLVELIVSILNEIGLRPLWDRNFAYGRGFPEQIRKCIAHAHVFLPLITESSSKRGWVHQEIGYAMALNVPVLPVARGTLPGEMLQELHAMILSDDPEEIRTQLTRDIFESLVNSFQEKEFALYECAELPEERTVLIAQYARSILEMGEHGLVRQKGAFGSFSIPHRVLSDPVWTIRYHPYEAGLYYKKLLRLERLMLEKHARVAGCKLIVNPRVPTKYSPRARSARLQTLLEFLHSMPDSKAQIAINDRMYEEENVTLVGDWFAAESVSMSGSRQTIFTRHAPSMKSRIEYFDQEFDELLEERGWQHHNSRIAAINEIEAIVAELETEAKTISGSEILR
ncbi:toll/interleukin-1 receptor domain-containing protein [Candidatus Solincola tengchongensis]|uniref:toll/interleukin-1 receptor domain-containing protein n=1 Tax=Candidatus Solincola tengchongensis TaxID=2900693 RepID=UPI00257D3494|nr:toll/interleukin-1 receptor domain-containing protein [Candidatus Solincola tengchongensis]